MIDFRPHASGSGGNFYSVHDGTAALAIDPGIRYPLIQRALNFQVSKLDGALLSHSHGDHAQGAVGLMKASVDVYASEPTWRNLGYFDDRSNAWPSHRAKILHHREPIHIGPWLVRPFDVPHDLDGTLGFMIQSPSGSTLVYATDAGYLPDRFSGVNVFCLECNFSEQIIRENVMAGAISTDRFKRTTSSHMSIERLIDCLRSNDLSKCRAIYLMHLSAANSNAAEFKSQIQRATGVATFVCKTRGGVE